MKYLSLKGYRCLNNNESVQALNRLVETRANLMPHEVASATGCDIAEAMSVLMLMYAQSLADAFLLVYHVADETNPPAPFMARSIELGLPEVPLICENCDHEIQRRTELSYDFLFKITNEIRFTV